MGSVYDCFGKKGNHFAIYNAKYCGVNDAIDEDTDDSDVKALLLAHSVSSVLNIPGCSENGGIFKQTVTSGKDFRTYLIESSSLYRCLVAARYDGNKFDTKQAMDLLCFKNSFRLSGHWKVEYAAYSDLTVDDAAVYSLLPKKYMSKFAQIRNTNANLQDLSVRLACPTGLEISGARDEKIKISSGSAITASSLVKFLERISSVVRDIHETLGYDVRVSYSHLPFLDDDVDAVIVGREVDVDLAVNLLADLGVEKKYETMLIADANIDAKTFTKKLFQVDSDASIGTAPYGYFMSYALAIATGVVVDRNSILYHWRDWQLCLDAETDLSALFAPKGKFRKVRVYAAAENLDKKYLLTSIGFLAVDSFDTPTMIMYENLDAVGNFLSVSPADLGYTNSSQLRFAKDRVEALVKAVYDKYPGVYKPARYSAGNTNGLSDAVRSNVLKSLYVNLLSMKMVMGTPLVSNDKYIFSFNQLVYMIQCVRALMQGNCFKLNFNETYDASDLVTLGTDDKRAVRLFGVLDNAE